MTFAVLRSFVKTAMALQADEDTPGDYTAIKAAVIAKYGIEKTAWDSGELVGLGTLAAPSVASLANHPMKDKHKDVAEVAGLGLLAAPYAHNIAKSKSTRYATSGIGKRLSKMFSH